MPPLNDFEERTNSSSLGGKELQMQKIEAVIFDWAGTVIDFGSRAPIEAILAGFRSIDFDISEIEARAFTGMAKREHIKTILEIPTVVHRWKQQKRGAVDDAVVNDIFQRFATVQLDVILDHSDLIPGVVDVVNYLNDHAIKIGSSTGYFREMIDKVLPVAAKAGFSPCYVGTACEAHAGRPAPWMIHRACEAMNVYPMSAVVKVDDTTLGVAAGRNAGCWSVGVSASGNLMGLSEQEYRDLDDVTRTRRLADIEKQLRKAGAHEVLETVADLPQCIERLNTRMEAGERPQSA